MQSENDDTEHADTTMVRICGMVMIKLGIVKGKGTQDERKVWSQSESPGI